MKTAVCGGTLYASLLLWGTDRLGRNRQVINDLNVFPIPDGDTGDNLYMTATGGCRRLVGLREDATAAEAAELAAGGMLLGARGNSGVILSRIFAGLAEGLAAEEDDSPAAVCRALTRAVTKAYTAVATPVEGTILTVCREGAEAVNRRNDRQPYGSLEALLDDLLGETRASLERTPELMPLLKQSGVVDSGGAGLYYMIEGMCDGIRGRLGQASLPEDSSEDAPGDSLPADRLREDDEEAFGYCTEFLLQLMASKPEAASFTVDGLKDYLGSVGGSSVVAFRDGELVKVHVHTKDPGRILSRCQAYGEYLKIKVENMTLQHQSAKVENRFSPRQDVQLRTETEKPLAVVAVAAGEGVSEMFREAGADRIVPGGQSGNPPAEAFLEAFRALHAKRILVLPNNKNIVLTARQAAELYDPGRVTVFPSASVGEGYAALTALDRDGEIPPEDELIAGLTEAVEGVLTGLVSRAVRDTVTDGITVKAGDWLGFVGSHVLALADSAEAAAEALAESLRAGERDVMILLPGSGVSADSAEALAESLKTKYPRTETVLHPGGQPVYAYMVIME